MTPDEALGRVVRDRIRELRVWRRWCANQPNPDVWADIRAGYAAELGALLRLLRESRRRPVATPDDRLALGDHFAGMSR